jgi:hypothetical protein
MRTTILASTARGSVSRRSGGWCFRLDAGIAAVTGRRHQISRQGFATKRDAVAALNTALTELNATTPEDASAAGATLSEYLSEWLEAQRPYLRASTLHSYRIAVHRIIGRLGDTNLNSLTPTQVQETANRSACQRRTGRPATRREDGRKHSRGTPQSNG